MHWKVNRERLFVLIYTIHIVNELFLLRTNIADLLTPAAVSALSLACKAAIYGLLAVYVTQFARRSTRQVFVICALLGVFVLAAYTSRATTMLQTLVLILCADGVDLDRVIKRCLAATAVIAAVTMPLAVAGLITNHVKDRLVMDVSRLSYGFGHVNTLGQMGFQFAAAWLYLKRNRRGFAKFIVPVCVTLACYYTSYSFSAVIVSALLLAAGFAVELMEHNRKLRPGVLAAATLVVLAIALPLVIHFWRNPMEITKQLRSLRNRFTYAQRYIKAYGIHLFGRKIALGLSVVLPGVGASYGYLDNGYARILVESGLLVFGAFTLLHGVYIRKLIARREALLLVIEVCYLVYAFMEYKAFFVPMNVFLLNIGALLWRRPAPPARTADAARAARRKLVKSSKGC